MASAPAKIVEFLPSARSLLNLSPEAASPALDNTVEGWNVTGVSTAGMDEPPKRIVSSMPPHSSFMIIIASLEG